MSNFSMTDSLRVEGVKYVHGKKTVVISSHQKWQKLHLLLEFDRVYFWHWVLDLGNFNSFTFNLNIALCHTRIWSQLLFFLFKCQAKMIRIRLNEGRVNAELNNQKTRQEKPSTLQMWSEVQHELCTAVLQLPCRCGSGTGTVRWFWSGGSKCERVDVLEWWQAKNTLLQYLCWLQHLFTLQGQSQDLFQMLQNYWPAGL